MPVCVLLLLSKWGNSTRVPMIRGRGGFDVSPLYRVDVEVVVAASPPSAVVEEEVLLLLPPSSAALLRFLLLVLPPFRLL